jgi:hypothetical protein
MTMCIFPHRTQNGSGSGALTQLRSGYRRAGPLTENGDLAEESLVHLPLPDGGAHQDPAVAVPVNSPQLQGKKG